MQERKKKGKEIIAGRGGTFCFVTNKAPPEYDRYFSNLAPHRKHTHTCTHTHIKHILDDSDIEEEPQGCTDTSCLCMVVNVPVLSSPIFAPV